MCPNEGVVISPACTVSLIGVPFPPVLSPVGGMEHPLGKRLFVVSILIELTVHVEPHILLFFATLQV